MAVLPDGDRAATSLHFIRQVFGRLNQTAQLDTNEVRLLIDGIDAGLDSVAATVNAAIDASVRTKATTQQKHLAVAYVALKRAGAL